MSTYVARLQYKITNLSWGKKLKKVFSEMSYNLWSFMAFKTNDQCYRQIYGMVFPHDLIFSTNVRIGMENNFAEGSFHFL